MTTSRLLRSAALALLVAGALIATSPTSVNATPAPTVDQATSPTAPCDAISPYAIPCTALGKVADAVSTECRRVGLPDVLCVLPLAHKVTQAATDAYLASWVHRTAQFQYDLGSSLAMRDTQWIGTHNSFNSLQYGLTISHADSNQQLSLSQQLDIDVRAIEIDLHYIPGVLGLLGPKVVTVCHGQGPTVYNFGCTTEPTFDSVLPEVATWLNTPANSNQVIMLYLEDELSDPAAYASTISTLDKVLRRPDGSSLIYRPQASQKAANGCTPMPNGISRNDIRATGARVIIVGSCAPGWSSDVFDWNPTHVESGSTSAYQPYPACDATYGPSVYSSQMVRYYEDSTLVSNLMDPSRPPANPEALTPAKVTDMTDCGVNLFGFDQLLPEDGRIQATLWSWAPNEPVVANGSCTRQGADGRWYAAACTDLHPAACRTGSTWTVTPDAVTAAEAPAACTAIGSTFDLPRAGDQNSALHAVAAPVGGAWINYSIT
ncbi:MAG TPA: hypothetical protein VHZ06_07985 [Marmoricola sp.]|jgi:hypothetical protein|nr:hypothetical protein [Marmoricola sp.]